MDVGAFDITRQVAPARPRGLSSSAFRSAKTSSITVARASTGFGTIHMNDTRVNARAARAHRTSRAQREGQVWRHDGLRSLSYRFDVLVDNGFVYVCFSRC